MQNTTPIEFYGIRISDVLAFIAMITSLFVAYRSSRLTKSIAEAHARPILAIYSSEYENEKGLALVNVGVGTAIITRIRMSRSGQEANTVAELFRFEERFKWDTFWRFQQTKDYVQAGERRMLARLTAGYLAQQGFKEDQALSILRSWQTQLDGIAIEIDYEDVFGNKQQYERRFNS